MKISLKWLKEYVDVPDLPENLQAFCDKLDLTGTGVEDVVKLGANFDNIVTGKIVSKEPHPDSDHMFVTMVDIGQDDLLQIVCGAQNFKAGDHVVVAKIGAVLPGNFKIKKSKLRGVMSCGMNCSEEELGLADSSEGIMILPENAPIGVPVAEYLGLSDTIIDTEITPNRPDCLSVLGCAREVGAIYDVPYVNPLPSKVAKLAEKPLKNITSEKLSNITKMPEVIIEQPERCPRYTARVINGVKVGPSPKWLVERINSMGARSINNIVDVTNYILYLYGQPLHAFDYDKLQKNGQAKIVVRPARPSEKFKTLDGEDRVLNPDMTVISTGEDAVALAGVMGGFDSEVTEDTTSILLETATFSPAHTSRTSRSLDLISESSMRYERKVDDATIYDISAASAALIMEVAGGYLCSGSDSIEDSIVDVWPIKASLSRDLKFRVERFNSMMGADISEEFIVKTLTNLGCMVEKQVSSAEAQAQATLFVKTPTFRPDLEREIDLYEEVLRIYGMDRIESTLPKSAKRVGVLSDYQKVKRILNNTLCGSGMSETISYSFADEKDSVLLGEKNEVLGLSKPVELINPMNADQKVMRQTIIPGLLKSVSYNLNRGVSNISLYEFGRVFKARNGQQKPKEKELLTGVMAGYPFENQWNSTPAQFDFFDAKGVIENICDKLNIMKVRFMPLEADSAPHLQPGRAAKIITKGATLGWVGEIHPVLREKMDIDVPVAAFELDMEAVLRATNECSDFEDVPVYPGISIDIAFVVDRDKSNEMMLQRITSAGGKLLKRARLFDVFDDENKVGEGKKSLTYSLEFRDSSKTLRREDVDKAFNRLIKKVCASTGAEIRS